MGRLLRIIFGIGLISLLTMLFWGWRNGKNILSPSASLSDSPGICLVKEDLYFVSADGKNVCRLEKTGEYTSVFVTEGYVNRIFSDGEELFALVSQDGGFLWRLNDEPELLLKNEAFLGVRAASITKEGIYLLSLGRFYRVDRNNGEMEELPYPKVWWGCGCLLDGERVFSVSFQKPGESSGFYRQESGTFFQTEQVEMPIEYPFFGKSNMPGVYFSKIGVFSLSERSFFPLDGGEAVILNFPQEELCHIVPSDDGIWLLTQSSEDRRSGKDDCYTLYQVSKKGILLQKQGLRLGSYLPYSGRKIQSAGEYLLITGGAAIVGEAPAMPSGSCGNSMETPVQYLYDIKADALYLVSAG